MERLNKYLAACGVASRRGADLLIADGRVKINNKLVTALGTSVGDGDVVSVDGKIVRPVTEFKYIMLYKPKGCVTTRSDEKGRKTVYDYLKDARPFTTISKISKSRISCLSAGWITTPRGCFF